MPQAVKKDGTFIKHAQSEPATARVNNIDGLKEGIYHEGTLFAFQGQKSSVLPSVGTRRRTQKPVGPVAFAYSSDVVTDGSTTAKVTKGKGFLIKPLAADCFNTAKSADFTTTLTVAYSGTCKILCEGNKEEILAGDRVFAKLTNSIEVSSCKRTATRSTTIRALLTATVQYLR